MLHGMQKVGRLSIVPRSFEGTAEQRVPGSGSGAGLSGWDGLWLGLSVVSSSLSSRFGSGLLLSPQDQLWLVYAWFGPAH
jgi:hypothetical protein